VYSAKNEFNYWKHPSLFVKVKSRRVNFSLMRFWSWSSWDCVWKFGK
jgi:hypothetical protein